MKRMTHKEITEQILKQNFYYTEWDYCFKCKAPRYNETNKIINNNYHKCKQIEWCVYIHYNKQTKEPFYVGMGNKNRPYNLTKRNSEWLNYYNNICNKQIKIIVHSYYDNELACENSEQYLIKELSKTYKLVNILHNDKMIRLNNETFTINNKIFKFKTKYYKGENLYAVYLFDAIGISIYYTTTNTREELPNIYQRAYKLANSYAKH